MKKSTVRLQMEATLSALFINNLIRIERIMPIIQIMDKTQNRVLIVDDDKFIRRIMESILSRDGYDVSCARNASEAFKIIKDHRIDLILLDITMPGIDGFQTAQVIKSDPKTSNIPIILITSLDTVENHVKALDLGVDDFLPKTSNPAEILARVRAHLKTKLLNDKLHSYQVDLERQVALRTQELKEASNEIILRLTAASEHRDIETGAHIKRMGRYSSAIAQKIGLGPKVCESILLGAPMHDIGKIGIPDNILLKPGKLNADEWKQMKRHTVIGYNILKDSKVGIVRMGASIALTHHERWDGKGYPNGLREFEIPLSGRIVALADVFDALTSKRPYKEAFPVQKAFGIIEEETGRHFDPDLVEAFFQIKDEILAIKNNYQDDKGKTPSILPAEGPAAVNHRVQKIRS